ncbi:hypothetical protein GC176_05890 [bacterium]|nr:hypothetical protein [bacterium]
MTRPLPDVPNRDVDGRIGVFNWLAHEVETRSSERSRPVICLMDGEHKLWDRKRELLPETVVEVLDLWHVMGRLWDVATALHGEDKAASREFVSARLQQLLEGSVGRVLGACGRHSPNGSCRKRHVTPSPRRSRTSRTTATACVTTSACVKATRLPAVSLKAPAATSSATASTAPAPAGVSPEPSPCSPPEPRT